MLEKLNNYSSVSESCRWKILNILTVVEILKYSWKGENDKSFSETNFTDFLMTESKKISLKKSSYFLILHEKRVEEAFRNLEKSDEKRIQFH